MEFNEKIHTKEFLLGETYLLAKLCSESREFLTSSLGSDTEILKAILNEDFYFPAAHYIASSQPDWLKLDIAKNDEIISLRDYLDNSTAHSIALSEFAEDAEVILQFFEDNPRFLYLKNAKGDSVAHFIAKNEIFGNWLQSRYSKEHSILKMENNDGITVAHNLAWYKPAWASSQEAADPEILMLGHGKTIPLAACLVGRKESLKNEVFMSKHVLSTLWHEQSIAELLCISSDEEKVDVVWVSLHLIKQGAAFKHSECIDLSKIKAIKEEGLEIIKDSKSEPGIYIKQAAALYSTVFHAAEQNREKRNEKPELNYEWELVLSETTEFLISALEENILHMEVIKEPDYFCEPSIMILNHVSSKMIFTEINTYSDDIIENNHESIVRDIY